jgi:hypothetical protein
MKRLLAALLFAALTASCSTPNNSSTVSYQLDGNGCLVDVSGYDIFNEVETEEGIRSVNYVWECGDYFNEAAEIDVTESKVTLIFEGTGCLKLTATMISNGYCTQGKAPVL